MELKKILHHPKSMQNILNFQIKIEICSLKLLTLWNQVCGSIMGLIIFHNFIFPSKLFPKAIVSSLMLFSKLFAYHKPFENVSQIPMISSSDEVG